MNDIDRYIREFDSCLRVGRRDRVRILTEVSDHLDDALAHEQSAGESDARAAIAQILEAFGSPTALATAFNAAAGTRAMRRAPVIAFLAGLMVLAGFLVAGITQTHTTTPANATLPTQTSFFFAVLSFQIALVAGFCAGSRALALWRNPVARADDRQFVRRSSIISSCALGLAALAWATAMGFAFDRLADPNTLTLWCGASIMLVGAGIGIIGTSRLRVNPSDDYRYRDAGETDDGLFGLGERGIGVVRRHPILACTTITALSAIPAMSHAETTLPGALPWGLMQAATVVIGFAVLGPTLRLRSANERAGIGTNVTPN